ncbi:leukotoxin LktA family filamentous adhesin [Bradyrhizobium sp. TM239]|uniref:leukotoxin LktA family filamentous adhesin n=1 Tax=Bradyrhizobium sp. TM239 TaxID=2599802 RepID=UPI0027D5FFD1|nr:leukotoxin LktA family filamentous adhesin [Bradyrhizobium sp. TM239]
MRGPSAARDNDERTTLRGLARFRSMSLLCAMQMVFLPVYSVRLQAQTANVIVPDGRTGTSLQTSGSVTNVTTSTVSGNNAFNSFSQFSVGQGNTVNLQLPTGTRNLVNIVRDAPVYVNGTLNSYMNGSIGGNVYFADPKGFVVGRSGVVNVGSLNVSTPTREFTDSLIGPGGAINGTAVGNLMAGSFPVSPDGNIRIYGRVNAQDGVRLTGQNVFVGGATQRDIANLDHAAKFAASVNSKGLRSASSITVSNGSIHIGAVNNARVNGRLTAHSRTSTPSNITVQAGNNIDIGRNARLNIASKTGDAGEIRLKAAQNLTVTGGARFNASAKTGNAGLVDFSANGVIDIGQGIKVNLSAANGKAGTLLIDPTDLVVGDAAQGDTGVTLSNSSVAAALAGLSAGADYLIQADHSITLAAHAMIDARRLDGSGHSTGNANNVIIDAPNIEIMNGAQILAQSVNFGGTTYADGNVTLRATASDIKLSGQATAATAITVDGKITGGTVSITATSTAVSSFLNGSAVGDLALVGSTLAASLLGLNGGYVAASATATININSHADINGRGDVTISAHATETASDPAVASTLLGSLTPVAAGVVVGKIDGNVTTNIASGATINAGGNLEIKALNDATIAVSALAASTSAQIVPTVAYSKGSVSTTANVETGAHIAAGLVNTSGSTLKVRAINNNSFSTSATSVAASGPNASGAVGAAVAISDVTTSATATLGASLGTSAANRMNGSVLVEATSDTTSNSTMASSIAGLPALIAAIQEFAVSNVDSPTHFVFDHMTSLVPLSFDFKVAGALSLANSTQSATAAIAQSPSGGAPSIYASGNVAVASNVIDRGVRSNATSSAITKDVSTGEGTAISAAVAWGNFTHNSNAYVGGGTLINAANIAVDATTELPITNTWLKWDGLGAVLSHLNGSLGVGGNILTSYANATADAGDTIGIAGSLNHFVVNNNTTAWVAGSASLTATCATAACGSSWSAGMDNGDVHTYNASIQIAATTTTASIDAAGNVGTLGFLPGNTSGGSSIGGALNLVQFNTNTIAGVSDHATLRAADDIAVNAITSDQFIAVAPSSGKAAGALALNGITSLGFLNNTTHASISSQATVYAPTVGVLAQQDLSVVTLAGAMSRNTSGGSAVGLAVAYLGANTDTSAYIGDNHSDIRPGPFSSNDPFAGNGGGSGAVNVDNLTISATTSGRITAAAVAASISEPQASSFSDKAGAAGAGATGGAAGVATAASKIGSTSGSSTSGFSIDLAGSSSISDVSLGTSACIKNTTVNKYTTTGTVVTNTIVQALNDTMLNNGSGSAALNLAGASAQGAAIGGAIAAAMSNNATLAYIYGTTMNNQSSATVQALNGGSEMVVALGVAGSKSNAASLSASVGIITDSANAYIESSTITGQSTGVNRALEVDAYQTTNIAIGGGVLYMSGGQAGVGIGLTYASIADPAGGNATDAHIRTTSISNYDTLLVLADSASVIAAGAASGGAATNGNALSGAVVVDEITPTTTAYINSGATVNINVGGVTVLADSGAVSALDTALGNLVKKSNNDHLASDTCTVRGGTGGQNCIDFGAAALNGGMGNGPGASIISVAGVLNAAQNAVGASIVYDTIATTHSAYIANVLLQASTANGRVNVGAVDSSKIQSVTIGLTGGSGQFAGVAGTTISSITNTVSAGIGNNLSSTSNSTVAATTVSVTATDNSSIKGSAALAAGAPDGNAGGLALVYSNIANNVSAGVTGSRVTATGSVAIGAGSNASISNVAIGIAASSEVGLAGSVVTSLMGTNVTASITAAGTNGINGADVTANNNVGVIASNSDKVSAIAGALSISTGAAGGAGSLVTNQITGTTAAYISGANTKVDALGTSSSDTLSVNNGSLVHAFDLGTAHAPTDTTPDLSENQDILRGLAVVASSHQAVVTNVASLAASSSIAIMINPITNVMSGSTRAYIDSAAIDTRLTSSTLKPQIEVAASSFSYSGAFGAGIAYGSSGGGGATIISTTMSRETLAYITNATVGGVQSSSETVGAVTVKANAEQDASSIAIGFNTGSVGLNVFQATTEAYVDGGALTAASLTVNANNNTGIFSANGSGAYGSQAAIGAAFLVQVSSNRTLAYVGDEFRYQGNGAAHTTALNLSGALDVEAKSKNRFEAYAIGGALSTGTAAIAGMANIEVANNTTIAGVYDTTLHGVTGGTAGAVTINANEDVAIKEIAGALAVGASGGGVGVGAAANVIVFKSRTVAESWNSNLNSSGAINVNALSTKEVLSYAVTAGIGGSVGIGATVGVIIIGTNTADADTQGQQTGQLNQGGSGTIASVNHGTSNAQGSNAVASGTAGNPNSANVSSTYDVSNVLSGGNDVVVAQIAGGNVTGTQVNVAATSANAAKMYLLGAGFAKNVGIGAGIGYTSVNSTVLANLSDYGRNGSGVLVAADTPLAVSAPIVTVAAVVKDATTGPYAGKTVDTEAIAGGAALYFGAQAAVAVGNVSNSVVALLGGQITGASGTGNGAAVMAMDSTTQVVFTGGVTGGAVAVGASVATASRTSSVAARVLNGSTVNVATLAVGASGAGTLTTTATALGGGIVAGVGADAEAHENSSVLAEIGSSASITTSATGVGTLVSASITPNLASEAIGVSVGGAAVGMAIAKSTVGATVTADVGDNASFSGGALAVTAMALVPISGTTTWAKALAGGGGSLIGAQGSLAVASENATVNAYGGTGIRLPNANVTIAAENDSAQYAEGTGLSSGFLALGATVAQTSSSAHTYAYLGAPADMDATHLNHTDYTGILRITATGTDTNVSNATVGAGGTYAGAAAVATTSSTAVTNARFDGGTTDDTLYFGGLSVKATHTTNYAASGDAYQASTAGVSAGKAQNDVTSTTTAEIGTHLIVNTDGGNIVVISKDNVNQAGGGARSGSGGSFSGAAALSDSHVTQYVTTNIGAGTILSLNGDPRTATGVIDIEAYNTLSTTDTASLATASFFAGGGAESNMTANATLAVNINARELFSVGKIFVGTAATMSASNNANASLYGAIAGVGASTNSWVHANQAVNVGSSTTIEAWRDINIYAGMSGDTITFSSVQATATTVVYNNTAIPISTLYRGTANAANDSSLTLADSSRVLGVRDIYLGATQGQVTASGNGSNYNPYLDIFSAKNSDNHSHTSGTGDVALNGLVVAGINNDVTITIDLGASAPTLSTTSPHSSLSSTLEYVADVDHFSPVKSWNHQTIQYTIVGGFNPYDNIVNQLATLTGLTATQIRTQLSTSTSAHPATMAPSGSDPTGDAQRQINALIQQAPYTSDAAGNAFAFGDILVSAGNVSILAQKLTGNSLSGHTAPSVTAQSSPTIRVENRGLDFMDFANLTVTNVTGGNITYRQIDHVDPDSHSNVTFTATPSATPIIDISATYNRLDPSTGLGVDGNGNQLTRKPDIYFDGIVTNENGLLKITSQLGSVVASQSLNAATIQMVAPNGSFIFLGGVGSFYNSNHDVTSQWAGVEYKPADNDTLTAVMAAATYLGAYGAYAYSPHIGDGGNHPYFYYCCVDGHSGVQQTAANSTVFTARMLMTYYDGLSLYSAIFLPMGNGSPNGGGGSVGSTATLAAMEGPTVQQISTAPWEQNTYAGQGVFSNTTHDTVTTHPDGSTSTHTDTYYSPFNCSGCSAYFQVVNIQNDVITPRTANTNASSNWASTTPSGYQNPSDRPFILGQAIIISAGVINVNGLIQSGTSSNYSVDIGGGVLSAINGLKTSNNGGDFAQAQANARNGSYYDITAAATTQFSSDIKIGVKYNALTDQIMVNGVVQGSGGYVYLNGKIISTSTDGTSQGTIAVKGGAGTITVNNTTGLQLVTNTINTGVSAPSVIQIVDQLQQQTTWYVYNPSASGGQQVSTYRAAGVNASSYTAAMLSGMSGTAGIQYTVKPNMYYQWVDTATLDRPTTSTQFDYGWHYTPNASGDNWTRTVSLVENVMQATGGGGNTGQLQTANFQEVVTATGGYHGGGYNTSAGMCCGADGHYDWFQQIYDHLTLTLTNTVKASNPINIQFSGGGASTVNVSSNSGIVINGPINNLSGDTTVIATGANSAITSGANANNPMISGKNVTLSADGGIGTRGTNGVPVQVQVYGGSLKADTIDRDIAIAAVGSLSIDHVKVNSAGATPQGSVFLSATGDVNSASAYNIATPVVIGKNIEINSTGGAIGATSAVVNGTSTLTNINPLVIQATGTIQANGTVDGGVLDSASATGTYIVQSKGDLRLGTIQSTGGPVFLEAAGSDGNQASILNGRAAVGLTQAQSQHLQDVQASLDLVSGNAATNAVNSYQSMVTSAYNDYFQLKNIAFTNGSTYNPTSVGQTVLRAQVAAKLGIDPADVTATQMKTEATTRFLRDQFLLGKITTDELKTSLTTLLGAAPADPLGTVFGSSLSATLFTKLFDGVATTSQRMPSNTALQTALGAYNANYSYTLASTERVYSIITAGSQWTQSQLAYTVSSSAVGAAPPPIDENVVANVSANQIMLYAPRGSVGNSAAPQTFTFTSVDSSSLTPEQRGLLATAGPGQLTVGAVTDPTTHVTTYTVSLSQQNLVVVDNPIAISAKALTNVYLGSKNSLALGGVTANYGPIAAAQANGIAVTGRGDVKLDAVTNISANVGGAVISGDIANLTLIAEHGNVGAPGAAGSNPATNANALQIAFADPGNDQLDQVSSAQGIYVKQTTGDLILGNIAAGNAIQLAATGSIYAEAGFTDRSAIHILGTDLDLRAGGSIGFNGGAFQPLQVNISGAVTGSAVGDLSILAVTGDLAVGTSGPYGALTAGGALTLNVARGALTINTGITSDGLMQLLANRGMTFAAGTSAAPVVATSSTGGVTLVASTLSMGAYSAINAPGLISVTTTGDATIGQLNSSLSYAAASNTPSIIVTAGGVASLGAIIDNGDGQTKFIASGAGAELSLSASNGIGSAAGRFTFSAARLSASASAGDIYVKVLADTEVSLLSAVKGSVDIIGTGGLTLAEVVAGTATGASGSFRAVANNGSILIGTADSSGSQTVHATQNVTFKSLAATGNSGDAGSINVTADTGFILAQTVTSGGVTTLGSVSAHGSASLVAATTITGNTLAATTGSGLLTANGGPLDWNVLNVGTTLGATAGQGSITFQTAQSGGTQTIHAHDNVTFNALTATGINGDAGSINVTADTGFIHAQTVMAGGVPTLGSVSAHGSARLISAGTNTGHNLTATTGNAVLSGTVVHWDNLNVGGTLDATATTGGITIGTAISGGTQTLHAVNDVVFSQLTTTGIPGDAGDLNIKSDTGSLRGGSISAHGDTHFDVVGPVSLDRISGDVVKMTSLGDLTINWVSVVRELDLAADTINVKGEQIRSNPAVPLILNITGYNGGVAKYANVSIDPDSIIVNQFRVVDANFWTDAPAVSILNGYVPGQLMLTTATQQILLNNRTPAPSSWPSLQLYQPGGVFTMSQTGNANVSNAYVVFYTGDVSATVTNYGSTHTCCNDFTGASMMRNIAVDGEGKESIETWLAKKDGGTFYLLGLSGQARIDALLTPRPVEAVGSGPAVNIEGLSDMRKLRQKGQRAGRSGWKDAAVETAKPAVGRLAQAW